jgi:pimeloyl-ACP methyl ester carboxylesterase
MNFITRSVGLSLTTLGVLASTVLPTQADTEPSSDTASCTVVRVPVTVPDLGSTSLRGELCTPFGQTPATVQLLVHGGTYTARYWDAHVPAALRAGYATFAVDRLGSGGSTRPPSAAVNLRTGAEALHDVVTALRQGTIGGRPFQRVVWVGNSFGSYYGWVEASMYNDVDAFVLTGALHNTKPSWIQQATGSLYPAVQDPKFANSGLDPGYLTTVPGTRDDLFYYTPTADPLVIERDERLKDTLTGTEIQDATALASMPPPLTAPSRSITVPTLLAVGALDNLMCGPPDGLTCTEANVAAQEAPYYSPQARLKVAVIPSTGHVLHLHRSAGYTSTVIHGWLAQNLAA